MQQLTLPAAKFDRYGKTTQRTAFLAFWPTWSI
jgi:hypothetical protein